MDALTYDELQDRLEQALRDRENGLVEADPDLYFSGTRRVLALQREMHRRVAAEVTAHRLAA